MKDQTPLWVGQFDDGETVVFDAAAQRGDEPEWVYLWSLETRRLEGYAKDVVRWILRKTADAVCVGSALAEYSAWMQERTMLNHRQRLEQSGLAYAGASEAGRREPRVTHCWNCHGYLNNGVHLECNICRWIVCPCGACGCR